jgi:hypothetical protein
MSRRKASETAAMRVFAAYATLTPPEVSEFELMRHGYHQIGLAKIPATTGRAIVSTRAPRKSAGPKTQIPAGEGTATL